MALGNHCDSLRLLSRRNIIKKVSQQVARYGSHVMNFSCGIVGLVRGILPYCGIKSSKLYLS